jgi:acyl dehydratase
VSVRRFADAAVGTRLPSLSFRITRLRLVEYCGASGDFNPIHWSQRHATAVGLPDVIAHGLCTMGMAGRVVTDWAGDPTRVLQYAVRFSAPVPVPDDDAGTTVDVDAIVTATDEAARTATVELTGRVGETTVLTRAVAVVRLD